jgi:hypothetical protein
MFLVQGKLENLVRHRLLQRDKRIKSNRAFHQLLKEIIALPNLFVQQ